VPQRHLRGGFVFGRLAFNKHAPKTRRETPAAQALIFQFLTFILELFNERRSGLPENKPATS
jgi:hypothetical protein